MSQSTFLNITHIEQAQSQKETTANEAFDTLDKLAGYHEVTATSGTATLTDAQAEHLLIRATGALSGALLIRLPAAFDSGWRIISNETTNAHALTVEFSGGAAAETITQGEAAIFLDGQIIQMGGGGGSPSGVDTFDYVREARDSFPVATSNYATLDTRNFRPVLDFDASTDEAVGFLAYLPENYDGSGFTVEIHYMMTSATTGNTVWQGAVERLNTDQDSDSFATAQGSGQSAVSGTSGILSVATITHSSGANMDSAAAGEPILYKLNRDADSTSATDDATGDAEVQMIVFKFPVA